MKAEILFIEAESAKSGWNVPLTAAAAYTKGITASLGENGTSSADIVSLNGANSKPFIANLNDSFWGQQMWWDTRTGVK